MNSCVCRHQGGLRTCVRRLALLLVFLVAFVSRTGSARADGLASDVYSDARDVITELIERDVAESLSADMGCYSPSGLLKYFPNTLQSVYERNFGALKDQLRREVVSFVANYAFECFRQHRTIPLDEFLPTANFDPNDSATNQCRKDVVDAGGPANYQNRVATAVRAGHQRYYYPIDRCDPKLKLPALGAKDSSVVEGLCPLVAALRSVSSTHPQDGIKAFAQAAARIAYSAWVSDIQHGTSYSQTAPAPDLERAHASVFDELLQRIVDGHYPDGGLLAAFSGRDWNAALNLASADFPLIFAEPNGNVAVHAGALRLLTTPGLPPEVAFGKDLLSDVAVFLKASGALAVDLPGEVPGVALGRALLARAGIAAQGTVRVLATPSGVEFVVDPKGSGAPVLVGDGLLRLVQLRRMGQEAAVLEQLFSMLGIPTDGGRAQLVLVAVQATVGLVQSVEETVTALKAIPKNADGSLDLITLLDALIRPAEESGFCPYDAGAAAQQLPAMHLTLCGILRQTLATADPQGLLLPILSAALEHDYRRVAVSVTDAVFSSTSIEAICCGKAASCFDIAQLYGRLAKSIVSYVLMPRGDEDQSLAARAAFKSAAVDVIREIGKRGGIDRGGARALFMPTGSLRASWSSSYQQSDLKGTGVRFVPTIDFLTARFRMTPQGSAAYLGISLTLVDLLAPFTEVVSRDQSSRFFNKDDVAWATLIHPRVSGLLAIPWLTKNTALVVGAGIRGAAPFDVGLSQQGQRQFAYATVLGTRRPDQAGYDTGDRVWPMIELSAGVQYIP